MLLNCYTLLVTHARARAHAQLHECTQARTHARYARTNTHTYMHRKIRFQLNPVPLWPISNCAKCIWQGNIILLVGQPNVKVLTYPFSRDNVCIYCWLFIYGICIIIFMCVFSSLPWGNWQRWGHPKWSPQNRENQLIFISSQCIYLCFYTWAIGSHHAGGHIYGKCDCDEHCDYISSSATCEIIIINELIQMETSIY